MIDTQNTKTIFDKGEEKPAEENPDNQAQFSQIGEKLFKDYQNYIHSLQPQGEVTYIHVDEIASKVAVFYENLLRVNESYGPAANDLAYLYADMNQNLDRALTLALSAKKLMPQNADVADTLGWVYLKSGSLLMAKNQFLEAIGLVVSHPVFRYHLGLAYYQEQDFPKAREAFREAVKLGLGKEESAQVQRMIDKMGAKG